ncbi:MAG: hypothetical protein IT473_00775 [Lysobacter sp.]|nr:hypothetical protein [Lysobacter sp.]
MNRLNPHLRKQEDQLRGIAASPVFAGLLPVSAAMTVLAMLAFWSIDNQNLRVLCLFVAACSGIAVFAAWTSAGHLRNAAAGTQRGRREPATLTLRKDEENDVVCLGSLTMAHSARRWRLVLASAPGQSPEPGTYEAQAVFLSDIDWPVLVYCGDTLLWPRQTPRLGHGPI